MTAEPKPIFSLLLIVIFVFPAKAHIEHYDSLSVIEFDIYRNNNRIGQHVFSFEKSPAARIGNFKLLQNEFQIFKKPGEKEKTR